MRLSRLFLAANVMNGEQKSSICISNFRKTGSLRPLKLICKRSNFHETAARRTFWTVLCSKSRPMSDLSTNLRLNVQKTDVKLLVK